MARLIPDFVSEDCRSSAERRLFSRLKDEVGSDWTVYHSLGLARHRYKVYAEADFVLVHPSAVLVFELKGGRVTRKDGAWYFTDRYGEMHRKKESPMQQAASAVAAIRDSVCAKFGRHSPQARIAYGYAAFFPDIEFAQTSPEWDLRRVYDNAAWQRPLAEVLRDAVSYSRGEMQRITNHEPAVLAGAELEALTEFLRGDFDRVPSLSAAIDGHRQEMIRLAKQQYAILDQTARNPRMVIEGAAGTGKTLIAFESARRHAAAGRRVLFVCFSRMLADHLTLHARRHGLDRNVTIGTLHSHCWAILRAAGREPVREATDAELFRDEIPRLVAESFPALRGFAPWDVLVVDEGQDLAAHTPFVEVLGPMLRGGFEEGHWMWFEDPRQRILRQGSDRFFDLERLRPSYFTLTKNWRNTNEVATYTSVASGFPLPELSGLTGPSVTSVCSGEDCARTLDDIVLRLLGAGCQPDSIVLLTARAEERGSFLSSGTVAGLALVRYDPKAAPQSGQIRYSSVFRFKGLEAKVVVLTDVDELKSTAGRMAAYVGMSRANSVLCVALSSKAMQDFEDNRLSFAESVTM